MSDSITQIDKILANFMLELETGKETDLETLYERHPKHEYELRQYFEMRRGLFDLFSPDSLSLADMPEAKKVTESEDAHDFYRKHVQIEGYELIEEIGRGGMGVVFEAIQTSLNRSVAIKVLREGVLASNHSRRRFEEEAKLIAKFQHDHIVSVIEFGQIEDHPYLVMPLVQGKALNQVIHSGPLTQTTACNVMLQVTAAIAAAHHADVIHRDIKPANILTDDNFQECKVVDFGLAVDDQSANRMTKTGDVLGTPGFLAPEIIKGTNKGDVLTDVYSLGATLYALLTGVPPFRAATPAGSIILAMESDPVSPRKINPNLAVDIESICLKCMNPVRERRYQSVEKLNDDLLRFKDGKTVIARPVGRLEAVSRWSARNRWLATAMTASVALLVGLLGLGAFSWFQITKSNKDLTLALEKQGELTDTANESLVGSIAAIEDFFNKVGSSEVLRDTETSLEFRKDLMNDGIGFLNDFLDKNKNNELLQFHVGRAYGMLGRLHANMRNQEEQHLANEKALNTLEPLYLSNTDNLDVASIYAVELYSYAISQLREQGFEAVKPKLQAAIDVSAPIVAAINVEEYENRDSAYIHYLARMQLSRKAFVAGETVQSLADATETAKEFHEFMERHSDNPKLLDWYSNIELYHGILHDRSGDPTNAAARYQIAKEYALKSLEIEPENAKAIRNLSNAIGNLTMTIYNRRRIAGEELTEEDRKQVSELAIETYEIKKGVFQRHPANYLFRLDYLESLNNLSAAFITTGEIERATPYVDLSLELLESELVQHPQKSDPDDWCAIVRLKQPALFYRARLLREKNKFKASLEVIREGYALAHQRWKVKPKTKLLINQLFDSLQDGVVDFREGNHKPLSLSIETMIFDLLGEQKSLHYNHMLAKNLLARVDESSAFFTGDMAWPIEYQSSFQLALELVAKRIPEFEEADGRLKETIECLNQIRKQLVDLDKEAVLFRE
jgi:serine/threonine protein kinase